MPVVGVIGAGAAGLCALKHLIDSHGMTPVLWESSKVVGGTWVYTDQLGENEHGLTPHSSMYKSLKTNIPKEVMAFPDFPFENTGKSFIHHAEVLAYLQQYAQHYDLERHIKFEHLIEKVTPNRPGSPETGWLVTVRDLNTNIVTTTKCDAIIICNGHYTVPAIPTLANIEQFSGTTLHSHYYREPADYAGRTVAVLGAGASGIDIAIELTTTADQVYLCHNMPQPMPSVLPPNLRQVAGISHVKEGSQDILVLRNGEEIKSDALLYCTGYEFNFPFLSSECGITVENGQVTPLYHHLIHCNHPTMALVGIAFQVCPFPFFDLQIRYFLAVLGGKVSLPTSPSMLASTTQQLEQKAQEGMKPHHFHKMGSLQWRYCDRLADEAEIDRIPKAVERLWENVHRVRKETVMTYKNTNYAITGKDTFEQIITVQ